MVGITLLVASLGLADSINPITIAIAIYLASTPTPPAAACRLRDGCVRGLLRRRARLCTRSGRVAASRGGGIAHARFLPRFGADRIGRDLARDRALGQASALDAATVAAVGARTKSSFALGAAVTALDLLTAFPYFGAIAAIVTSGLTLPAQVLLLVMFNVLYVLPLAVVVVADSLFGVRAEVFLARAREAIERLSPVVLTILTLATGIALVFRGANGLAAA